MNNRPRVGIGVVIIKDGKVLFGKRKNAHGAGAWACPGGHLEFGESWEDCARREVLEETGLEVGAVRFGTVTNDIMESDEKHYITICMVAEYVSGEPRILEPEKCEGWEWFDWDDLPQPLFQSTVNQLQEGWSPLENEIT